MAYQVTNNPFDRMLAKLIPQATRADVYDEQNGAGSFEKIVNFHITMGETPKLDPHGWQIAKQTLEKFGRHAVSYNATVHDITHDGRETGRFYSLELALPNDDAVEFYDDRMKLYDGRLNSDQNVEDGRRYVQAPSRAEGKKGEVDGRPNQAYAQCQECS